MRIAFGHRVFQFKALPFGIASAPWLCTKTLASIKVGINLSRLSLFHYLNDWLGVCLAKGVCTVQAAAVVKLGHTLGLIVYFE